MKVPFRRDRREPPPCVPEGAMNAGPLTAVPEGRLHRISDHPPIAVVRHGDTVHAFEDRCPHKGALLSRGTLTGEQVTCPSHKATFRVDTGKSLGELTCRDVRTYTATVLDGSIYITPAPRTPRDARRAACGPPAA